MAAPYNSESRFETTDSVLSSSIPPFEQLLAVRKAKEKPLEEGDIWYIVSKSWYTRWENYCLSQPNKLQYDKSDAQKGISSPGPIDNTDITDINPHPGQAYDLTLPNPVVEGNTIEFIPKEAYELLVQWYAEL